MSQGSQKPSSQESETYDQTLQKVTRKAKEFLALFRKELRSASHRKSAPGNILILDDFRGVLAMTMVRNGDFSYDIQGLIDAVNRPAQAKLKSVLKSLLRAVRCISENPFTEYRMRKEDQDQTRQLLFHLSTQLVSWPEVTDPEQRSSKRRREEEGEKADEGYRKKRKLNPMTSPASPPPKKKQKKSQKLRGDLESDKPPLKSLSQEVRNSTRKKELNPTTSPASPPPKKKQKKSQKLKDYLESDVISRLRKRCDQLKKDNEHYKTEVIGGNAVIAKIQKAYDETYEEALEIKERYKSKSKSLKTAEGALDELRKANRNLEERCQQLILEKNKEENRKDLMKLQLGFSEKEVQRWKENLRISEKETAELWKTQTELKIEITSLNEKCASLEDAKSWSVKATESLSQEIKRVAVTNEIVAWVNKNSGGLLSNLHAELQIPFQSLGCPKLVTFLQKEMKNILLHQRKEDVMLFAASNKDSVKDWVLLWLQKHNGGRLKKLRKMLKHIQPNKWGHENIEEFIESELGELTYQHRDKNSAIRISLRQDKAAKSKLKASLEKLTKIEVSSKTSSATPAAAAEKLTFVPPPPTECCLEDFPAFSSEDESDNGVGEDENENDNDVIKLKKKTKKRRKRKKKPQIKPVKKQPKPVKKKKRVKGKITKKKKKRVKGRITKKKKKRLKGKRSKKA